MKVAEIYLSCFTNEDVYYQEGTKDINGLDSVRLEAYRRIRSWGIDKS